MRTGRRPLGIGAILLAVTLGGTLQGTAHRDQATGQAPPPATPVPPQPTDPAQQPPGHGQETQQPGDRRPAPFPAHQRPLAPPEVLARGKAMYGSMCSACHGADARGGQLGGVNLLRSPLVLSDRDGEALIPVVKGGRPGTAMPPIPMPDDDIKAVAAFLHSLQAAGSRDGAPPPGEPVELDVVVGDAKAGAAYFAKTCASCHSPTGDLAGIATRVPDGKSLQNLWVSGGRTTGRGAGRRQERRGAPVTVKVTLPGETLEGRLVRIDDFFVTVGLEDGTARTIRRSGDTPLVEVRDPREPHTALLAEYTNENIHDVTAYLATLK